MVVVDNLGAGPDVLDEAKDIASKKTGIPVEKMLISSTHTHSAAPLEHAQRTGGGLSQAVRRGHRGFHHQGARRAAARRRRRRGASAAGGSLQPPLVSQAGQDAAESLRQTGQGEDESRHESRRARSSRRSDRSGHHDHLRAGCEAEAARALRQLLAALRRRRAAGTDVRRLLRRVRAAHAVAGARRRELRRDDVERHLRRHQQHPLRRHAPAARAVRADPHRRRRRPPTPRGSPSGKSRSTAPTRASACCSARSR